MVITIVGILISLLLPAVQAAREAARCMSCGNNMKQVSLGLHGFHNAKGHLPPGTYNVIPNGTNAGSPKQQCRCWMHDVLPYIDQASLYAQFDTFHGPERLCGVVPRRNTVISVLMCPSDPASPKLHTYSTQGDGMGQGFSGNLVACAASRYLTSDNPGSGGDPYSTKLDGLMFSQSSVSFDDVLDGLSNTAMVSEVILTPDVSTDAILGRYYNSTAGTTQFTTLWPPNTNTPDQFRWCDSQLPEAPCIWSEANGFITARSYHRGGANLGLADGSVRWVSNSVDQTRFKPWAAVTAVNCRRNIE